MTGPPFSGEPPLVPPGRDEDPELWRVADALTSADPDGSRIAEALRNTIDTLLDGEHTGRWNWRDLRKTEKTHMGTLVEIRLHKDFDFDDGDRMDYKIAGIEVDCKFSQVLGGWELPPEAMGHLCLVVTANDDHATWQAGLVRVQERVLGSSIELLGSPAGNRDGKRKLRVAGQMRIVWLWGTRLRLPENLFQTLSPEDRERIFTARSGSRRSSGQARLKELFRVVQGRVIRRAVVLTVAQQDDGMKRARDCRLPKHLGNEGFLILGHQENDPSIARALGLPVPRKGQFVSVRVHPAEDSDTRVAEIAGNRWRIARPGDPPVPAPTIRPARRT